MIRSSSLSALAESSMTPATLPLASVAKVDAPSTMWSAASTACFAAMITASRKARGSSSSPSPRARILATTRRTFFPDAGGGRNRPAQPRQRAATDSASTSSCSAPAASTPSSNRRHDRIVTAALRYSCFTRSGTGLFSVAGTGCLMCDAGRGRKRAPRQPRPSQNPHILRRRSPGCRRPARATFGAESRWARCRCSRRPRRPARSPHRPPAATFSVPPRGRSSTRPPRPPCLQLPMNPLLRASANDATGTPCRVSSFARRAGPSRRTDVPPERPRRELPGGRAARHRRSRPR